MQWSLNKEGYEEIDGEIIRLRILSSLRKHQCQNIPRIVYNQDVAQSTLSYFRPIPVQRCPRCRVHAAEGMLEHRQFS